LKREPKNLNIMFYIKLNTMVIFALKILLMIPSSVRSQGNYCGTTWMDAVSRCAKSCPSGAPSDCFNGETCFAGTPVSAVGNLKAHVLSDIQTNLIANRIYLQCTEAEVISETPPPVPYAAFSTPPPVPAAAVAFQPAPDTAISSGGTCGDGQIGNGICPIAEECCSVYGYCGTSPVHCDNKAAPQTAPTDTNFVPSTGGSAPSIYGTCGGGDVGNGICADNNECCSMYGL
jgi:hypothetical protein